jgi:hypothetical protein
MGNEEKKAIAVVDKQCGMVPWCRIQAKRDNFLP